MTGNILVVEDDKFTGRMMELQFHKHGYDITVTPSGEDALKCLEENTFDLVLSDVTMPGISGLELLRQIRTKHDRVQLPVILVTAMENSPKMGEALRLDVNDFFTKPKEFGLTLTRVKMQIEWRNALLGSSEDMSGSGLAFRCSEDGLWSWSIKRDKVQYSKAWKTILGYDPHEVGNSIHEWYDRIHPEDVDQVRQAMRDHMDRSTSQFQQDFRMRTRQGAWVWVHAFGVALFDKTGAAARMVGSLSAITDKKELARKWDAVSGRLTEVRTDLDRFCNQVSLTPADRSELTDIIEKLDDIRSQYGSLI